MDTRKYEALIRIAEEGTVSAAADVMGYTQAGVTQMLNSAEKELGIRVFDRTNKGAVLTEEGKRMLPLFRQIVNCQESIDQEAALIKGLEIGTVRVAGYSSIVISWIPEILAVFSKEHPGIEVWVTDCNVQQKAMQKVRDGEIDIAFCKITDDLDLDGEGLFRDRYLIAMSEKNPLSKKKKISVSDLEGQMMLIEKQGLMSDLGDDGMPGIRELTAGSHYSSTLLGSLQNMVKGNIGISISSDLMMSILDHEGVVAKPFDPDTYRTLGYCVRDRQHISSATKAFIECTKKVIGQIL